MPKRELRSLPSLCSSQSPAPERVLVGLAAQAVGGAVEQLGAVDDRNIDNAAKLA
jgi:hypothetical protein